MQALMNKPTVRPSAPVWVRAVVWVLFAVLGVSALYASGAFDQAPAQAPSSTVVVAPVAAYSPGVSAACTTGPCNTTQDAARNALIAYYQRTNTSTVSLLPMDRWGSATDLKASNGWLEIADKLTTNIANFMFSIAQFFWGLISWVMSAALGFNMFANSAASKGINDTFVRFSHSIISSGVVIVVLLLALIGACMKIVKGGKTRAVNIVMAAVIPVALLMALTARTGGTETTDASGTTTYNPTPGGPLWFAKKGVGFVDDMAGSVGTGLGLFDIGQAKDASYANVTPSCEAYKKGMYDTFEQWRDQTDGGNLTASASLTTVSYLWERAYLTQWIQAQYGGSRAGTRMWCHQLEAQAGTPRAVQVETGIAAGYPSIDDRPSDWTPEDMRAYSDWNDDIDSGAFNGDNTMWTSGNMGINADGTLPKFVDVSHNWPDRRDPYTTIDRGWGKGYQASLFLWAACVFDDAGNIKPQQAWNSAGQLTYKDCRLFWYGGVNPGEGAGDHDGGASGELLQWGDSLNAATSGTMVGRDNTDANIATYDPATSDDLADIRGLVGAFRGDNGGQRMTAGLLAVITSVAYLYVLGGIGLGGLMMKIGFGLAIAFLPGTLLLYALYARSGQANHPGKKLLKITVGFMAASFVLTGMLVLLLQTILLLEATLGTLLGSYTTFVIPLVALVIVRKTLKLIGMGDIATAKGALAMGQVTLAAAQAGPGKRVNAGKKSVREFDKAFKPVSDRLSSSRAGRFLLAPKAPGSKGSIAERLEAQERQLGKGKDRAKLLENQLKLDDRGAEKYKDLAARAKTPEEARAYMAQYAAAKLANREKYERLAGPLAADAWERKIRDNMKGRPGNVSPEEAAARARDEKRRDAILATADPAMTQEEAARATTERGGTPVVPRDADGNLLPGYGLDGKPLTAAARRAAEQVVELTAQYQFERDENGDILTGGPSNLPVFGFTKRDADGNVIMVSAAEAGFDRATGTVKDGYSVLHTPRTDLSTAEAAAAANAVAHRLGVDPASVLGSTVGMPPIARLQVPTDTDPRGLPAASTLDGSCELARQAMHYIPAEYKERFAALVQKTQMSVDGQNMFLNLLDVASGGVDARSGARTDFLLEHGIDLDTDAGVAELEAYHAGQPSRIDGLVAPLSAVAWNNIVGQVQRFEATRSPQARAAAEMGVARAVRAETAKAHADGLRARLQELERLNDMRRMALAAAAAGNQVDPADAAELADLEARVAAARAETISLVNDARQQAATTKALEDMTSVMFSGDITRDTLAQIEAYAAGQAPHGTYTPIGPDSDLAGDELLNVLRASIADLEAPAKSKGAPKKESARTVVSQASTAKAKFDPRQELHDGLGRMQAHLSGDSAGLCAKLQKELSRARHPHDVLDKAIAHAEEHGDREMLAFFEDLKERLGRN